MNSVERVKAICAMRKIPISRLEKDLGFSNGYIGQLRRGTFPYDRLVLIAKYLGVSEKYLSAGEEEQKENPGTNEGAEALNPDYYKLNEHNKTLIDQMIEQLLKAQSGD